MRTPLSPGLPGLLVALLGGALFVASAASHRLQGPDEPRYGLIVREMVASGDAVVLTLDGELYREKPPLWFWAAAGASRALGRVDALSVRLPGALAGAALLLVVAMLGGTVLGDRRAGVLAAALYALCVQGIHVAPRAAFDTMLTLFTTASALVFLRGLGSERAGFRAHVVGWVLLGLGLLVKGPPAFLPPLLAVVAFALARRDARALLRVAPLRGIAVSLAVVGLWLVPWALRVGGEEVARIWTLQIRGRVVESHAHAQPVWYYLQRFPEQFLPWTLLLPAVVVGLMRRGEHRDPGRRTLLLWLLGGLVVFSLVSGKRTIYLLPFYPAACLLAADALRRLGELGRTGRATAVVTALLPAAVLGALAALVRSGPAIALGAVAVAASAWAVREAVRADPARASRVAVAALLALAIPGAGLAGPVLEARKGPAALVHEAQSHLRPEDVPVLYREGDRILTWSTGRRWRQASGPEALEALRSEGPLLIAGEAKRLVEIPGLREVGRAEYDGDPWVIGRLAGR